MRKLLAAAVFAATTFAIPLAAAPAAHASYTLCDDEGDDTYVRVGGNTIGVDTVDPTSTTYFVCVQQVHVGIRIGAPIVVVVCTYFTADGDSSDDFCIDA